MKKLKKLFYGLCLCIFLVCVAILVVASKPEWSEKLSKALYGEDSEVPHPTPEVTMIPDREEEENILPQNTPMVYETPKPGEEDHDFEKEENTEYKPKTIDIKTVVPPKAPVYTYVSNQMDVDSIPESLKVLNGYAEISETLAEIEKAEAEKLKNELSEGDTGALLVFDQNFYPYYHMLEDSEKELYRQIYANAYARVDRFAPCVEIFSTNLGRVVEAVWNDNPVLFWVENSYGCKYGPDGRVVEISIQYNDTAKKPEQSMQMFNARAEEILAVARTLAGDYEKEKYVHDKLLSQINYAADAPMNQSAYSALVNGKTVCAGYARAFQYLMQQLGIPCFYCRGYSGENHAWNIVELYGDYYNVDLTWDDSGDGAYSYFNKSDEELKGTHVRRGMSVKLPACRGNLYGGLEEKVQDDNTGTDNPALALYYKKICDRIEGLGLGKATYSDILEKNVWLELEEAYTNGNNSFREDYLIRSLHKVGAEYCIISLSAEEITENAYEVSISMIVR